MSFRFRKSLKIAPGVRVNIGKQGFTSLGVGKTNFGKRGVYQNFTIPGTGISYRATIAEHSRSSKKTATPKPTHTDRGSNTVLVKVALQLSDDGELLILDDKGKPAPQNVVDAVRQQNKPLMIDKLQEQADIFNGEIDKLVRIHLTTPRPEGDIVVNTRPETPKLADLGIGAKFLGKLRERTEENNRRLQAGYERELSNWQRAEEALRTDTEVMSAVLANAFSTLSWPRETAVSFEVRDKGSLVLLDVDLPEVEDMPDQEAVVNRTQLRLNKKVRSAKAVRLDYLTHIHAIGFKFIGEVFAHLPTTTLVVLSGYSQRVDKSTARVTDQYLYSVRVARDAWRQIDFEKLDALDVVECFTRFDLRRKARRR